MENKINKNLKVLIAQLNTIPSDIDYNKNKILNSIALAQENNVDLIVTQELFLYGYYDFSMLKKFPFILKQIEEALEEIRLSVKNTTILLNYPKILNDEIVSEYALISKDGIRKIKNSFEFKNVQFGIIFRNNYNNSEKIEFKYNPECLICPVSLISRTNSEYYKNQKLENFTKLYNANLIYVNQIGAVDESVYDGISKMYNSKGEIVARCKAFEEENYILELNQGGIINNIPSGMEKLVNSDNFSLDYENDLDRTYKALVLSIRDYFSKNGFTQAVLGLSGGLDSAVCATITADALGKNNVLGVSMPSKLTSQGSKTDASELAQNLGINFIEVAIKDIQNIMTDKFDFAFSEVSKNWCNRYTTSYTQDNIQARSRATILWGIANEYDKTLTIATSDKSESHMGYSTINGDMTGGFSPIADVTKTKLFALARWMNKNRIEKNAIPISTIEKPPGAELAIDPRTGKTLIAEDALMPYEFLDEVIWRIENKHQSTISMLHDEFLYEKRNRIDTEVKKAWLEKFFRRLHNALYKQHITPPYPIIDSHSINKVEYKQPIVSRINYWK